MKEPLNVFLKNQREEIGVSQQEVANYVGVSKSAVSRWESGDIKNMGIDKLKKYSEIMKIDPLTILNYEEEENTKRLLSEGEKNILRPFNKLNDEGQEKSIEYTWDLVASNKYEKLEVVEAIGGAAAGSGFGYLDTVTVEKTISKKYRPSYDLIIPVEGDSMEPKIYDGSLAFVRVSTDYENGKIYVVDADGKVYIKKVYFENDHIKLRSINTSYDDIIIDDSSSFRVIGEVVDWE